MKKMWFFVVVTVVATVGFWGCEKTQELTGGDTTKETWVCTPEHGNFTITLENHPEENKFYTYVENPNDMHVSFGNGWVEYKIVKDTILYNYDGIVDYRGDMMYFLKQWDSDLNLTWSNPNMKWFMQHTGNTFVLAFAGASPGPGGQMRGYTFVKVR